MWALRPTPLKVALFYSRKVGEPVSPADRLGVHVHIVEFGPFTDGRAELLLLGILE